MTRFGVASLTLAFLLPLGCGDESDDPDDTGMSGLTMATMPTTQDPTTDTTGSPTGDPSTTDPSTTANPTSADGSSSEGGSTTEGVDCPYPDGAVEPMALNEVLFPYSWPEAIHGDGTSLALDLADAPCDFDELITWSPHKVLLFVSVPQW